MIIKNQGDATRAVLAELVRATDPRYALGRAGFRIVG